MREVINKNSNCTLKRISELHGMTFFVEAYQRGYKWDVQQVLDLLFDIDEFEVIGSRFYCLQPVVVKKIEETDSRIIDKNIANKDIVYELIDGQQRLTNIFIILSLLAKDQLPFQLIYKTRPESESFLNNIANIQPVAFDLLPDNIKETNRQVNEIWKLYITHNPENDNVDNYHFFKTSMLVYQWSQRKDIVTFIDKLLQHVKVIWYNIQNQSEVEKVPVQTKNAEQIFINFNQGKIQLEQAELIKALFVIKFKEIVNLEIRSIHINQFAEEWNNIEAQLQDDRFWYFVSNDISDKKRYNRIDLFFDILSNKSVKTEDYLFAYHFYLKSNKSIDQSIDNWKKLKDLFELLKEWYDDRLLYHLIGIIIYLEIKTIPDLISIYKDKKTIKNKIDFEHQLKSILAIYKLEFEIAKLDYKSPKETKIILHLFNIATYFISDFNYRFPFDKLKTQVWSLEHIHAQKADKFTDKQEFIDWLEDVQPLLEDIVDNAKLQESKNLLEELKNKELREIKDKLLAFHNTLINILNKDNIDNLCLLDKNTNSSLGNNTFIRKREMILEIDNKGEIEIEGEKHKVFIPIATKNVFLKYYTADTRHIQFTYWGKKDREDYISAIEEQLENFLSNA
ncbi:Protein of unknown function DUF262 [Aquiflexum balticum DSM 16537]|uniref:GmrSD restriction endonucleases N-terminal domain-containing protein n=1 Tax=Aquiflexum balticum DSM 16537 TaxID=758820 RepID=A0A1W2HA97_9BACT|nr:DUF262 domain-containing protein [Aquiflexum balticum]SMD45819.1 Protein of unknown function DUF262 [Aquiflexum balticum DSM 16537]